MPKRISPSQLLQAYASHGDAVVWDSSVKQWVPGTPTGGYSDADAVAAVAAALVEGTDIQITVGGGTITITSTASGGGGGGTLLVNLLRLINYTTSGGGWSSNWTDGNLDTNNYADAGGGTQERVVDLGQQIVIDSIRWWFYYGDARIYQDVEVAVSPDNSTWTVLRAQATYDPDADGLEVAGDGDPYRYVRFHSEGSDSYPNNEWVELQVLALI